MSEVTLRIAKLEHALSEARAAIERLEDERTRLARRNALLIEVLGVLRDGQSADAIALIDQALGFDGQPWSLPELPLDELPDPDEDDGAGAADGGG